MFTHIAHPLPTANRLEELGNRLASALYNGPCSLEMLDFIALDEVFLVAVDGDEPLSPEAALTLVASRLADAVSRGDYAETTVTKAMSLQSRFAKYLSRAKRIDDITDVCPQNVVDWIEAPSMKDGGKLPSARTKDNRRWAADLFFRELRALGVFEGDPLLDVGVLRDKRRGVRALTDAEVELCRLHSFTSRRDTRRPVGWAIAEAGASTSEISNVIVADVDIKGRRVWLCGGRQLPRWGELTTWGVVQLQRRIEALDHEPTVGLVYDGNGSLESKQASACDIVHETLGRAGLRRDPAVKPASLRIWLARRIFEETHDVVEVAHRLGFRDLDNAVELLDVPMGRCDVPPAHRKGGAQ